ncbi:MAG TPA: hypothetical protein ENI42_06135, partial [Thermoplasmatales archaeon]|nr:hypothetical protein [Thermoplasmatales archaeon]
MKKLLMLITAALILAPVFPAGASTLKQNKDSQYFTHFVFCEFATNTTSPLDPQVSNSLFNLYNSKEYPFFYVSMVSDKEQKALDRLQNHYNITGYPTLFLDGGYKVVYGKPNDENTYVNNIMESGVRETSPVTLTVSAGWFQDCCNKKVLTDLKIRNNGDEYYNGHVRVYLVEINSRWYDSSGNPYHFGFLAYTIDRDVSVSPKNNLSISSGVDVTTIGYPDALSDNLMIIAVLFNEEQHEKYSDPPADTHSFSAHYVDAVDADTVKGELSKGISILKPSGGRIYLFGLPIPRIFFKKPLVICKIEVEIEVNRFLQAEKVELYMDDQLKNVFTETPYTWVWDETAF